MSAATNAAITAALTSTPYAMISHAQVGTIERDGVESSSLFDLLVAGETAILGTSGEEGAALFTSARVLVAERVGILNRRRAVKAFRRADIAAYSIDADGKISLTLLGGAFGSALLVFGEGFDPMLLSQWLGETLVSSTSTFARNP